MKIPNRGGLFPFLFFPLDHGGSPWSLSRAQYLSKRRRSIREGKVQDMLPGGERGQERKVETYLPTFRKEGRKGPIPAALSTYYSGSLLGSAPLSKVLCTYRHGLTSLASGMYFDCPPNYTRPQVLFQHRDSVWMRRCGQPGRDGWTHGLSRLSEES